MTTIDINGGTIDGTTIGGTTPGAGTFSSLVATTADINAGTIDNTDIGVTTPGTGKFDELVLTGAGDTTTNFFFHSSAAASGSNWATKMYHLDSLGFYINSYRRDGGAEQGAIHIQENTGKFFAYAGLDVTGSIVGSTTIKGAAFHETHSALSGTSPTINCAAANVFTITLSGNTTFGTSNVPASGTAYACTLVVTGASTYTIMWPSGTKWDGGVPASAPAAGAVAVYTLITRDGGTTWYAFQAGAAMS